MALDTNPRWSAPRTALSLLLSGLGRGSEALVLAEEALALSPADTGAANARGMALLRSGRSDEAIAAFEEILSHSPEAIDARINLATALIEQGLAEEAEPILERAAADAPTNSRAVCNLAKLKMHLSKVAEALAPLDRLLESQPGNIDALFSRAHALEMTNDLSGAKRDIEAGLNRAPQHPGLGLVAAILCRRNGDFAAALDRLNDLNFAGLPDDRMRIAASFEKAQVLDRLDRHAEAFAAFGEANHRAHAMAGLHLGPERDMARLDALAVFADEMDLAALPAAPADDRTDPVFMVGFPRSGTTLTDRILDAHPSLSVLEEVAIIPDIVSQIADRDGGYPVALPSLTDAEIRSCRDFYFGAVAGHLPADAGRIIDKLPLNGIHMPLIRILFPTVAVVLNLRHPADCVLSCFMQNFRLNAAMLNYLTLESAARHYDKVMGLVVRYEAGLTPPPIRVRYEDLVADLEETARRMVAALDLPWDDAVLGFQEKLKGQKIATPGYAQVAEPIYKRAAGRWQRYREQMAPVLPVLEPWIDRWDYSAG